MSGGGDDAATPFDEPARPGLVGSTYDYSIAASVGDSDKPFTTDTLLGRNLEGGGTDAVLYASGQSYYGTFGGGLDLYDYTEYDTPIEIDLSVFEAADIKQIVAGEYHTLVVLHDKTAWASGGNYNGQLCTGNTDDQATFVQISLSDVERVAAGASHSIIILSNGTAFGCGLNDENQLGVPTSTVTTVPVLIPIENSVVDAAAGYDHTVFLTEAGQCFGTGRNDKGQLGLGDNDHRYEPAPVSLLENFSITQVAAGYYHTVFLDSSGTAHTAGHGTYGQLGDGGGCTDYYVNTPYKLTAFSSQVEKVQCTLYSTSILLSNSTVQSVGRNSYGELGAGVTMGSQNNYYTTFQEVLVDDIQDFTCGISSCFFFDKTGVLFGTGRNREGQLGVGDEENKNVPTEINMTGIDLISPGYFHTHFLYQQEDPITTEIPTTTTAEETTTVTTASADAITTGALMPHNPPLPPKGPLQPNPNHPRPPPPP